MVVAMLTGWEAIESSCEGLNSINNMQGLQHTIQRLELLRNDMIVHVLYVFLGTVPAGVEHGDDNALLDEVIV